MFELEFSIEPVAATVVCIDFVSVVVIVFCDVDFVECIFFVFARTFNGPFYKLFFFLLHRPLFCPLSAAAFMIITLNLSAKVSSNFIDDAITHLN